MCIVRVSSLEAERSIYVLSATGLFLSFIYCDILYVKSLQGTNYTHAEKIGNLNINTGTTLLIKTIVN